MKISFLKIAYALIVLCGVAYAFVELRGPNGIHGLFDKRQQVRQLEAETNSCKGRSTRSRIASNASKSDPREQDKEIRDRLKLASPDEKVFILDEKK